ncbi:hypothetical protein [Falsiroseomonas oryziterrae]|uniref:hypothetical protein n=1 Tax=Falsiroseomonas oryziterrae TaxID=2911368 RepID=UPI001F3C012C|nr:hypothetical protein [Roseomonas sp. NPKOSM-4]
MAQLVMHRPRVAIPGEDRRGDHARGGADPGAAARGILLALALSSVGWVALALLVPRLW